MIGFTATRVSFFETSIQTVDKKCRIAGNKGCKGWSEKGGGWGSNANSAFVFPPPPLFVAQVTPALQIGLGQASRWKSQGQDIEKNQISRIIFKSEEAYSPPNFQYIGVNFIERNWSREKYKARGWSFLNLICVCHPFWAPLLIICVLFVLLSLFVSITGQCQWGQTGLRWL